MEFPTHNENIKVLVALAIEHTLLDFGKDVHDLVVERLNDNDLHFSDCFDHPEYLTEILKDLFGKSYTKIIHSINILLDDSASDQLISDFLVAVRKS